MEEDPDVDKKACHLNRQPRKCLLHHTAKFGPNMVDLDTLDTTMQPGPGPWAGIVEYQQMAEFVLCTWLSLFFVPAGQRKQCNGGGKGSWSWSWEQHWGEV